MEESVSYSNFFAPYSHVLPLIVRPATEKRMEVVFGSPQQHCAGSGVCFLTDKSLAASRIPCPHTPVHVSRLGESLLQFRFDKKEIGDKRVSEILSRDYFNVDSAYRLPRYLTRYWGMPALRIAPGRYGIYDLDENFIIYFIFSFKE